MAVQFQQDRPNDSDPPESRRDDAAAGETEGPRHARASQQTTYDSGAGVRMGQRSSWVSTLDGTRAGKSPNSMGVSMHDDEFVAATQVLGGGETLIRIKPKMQSARFRKLKTGQIRESNAMGMEMLI